MTLQAANPQPDELLVSALIRTCLQYMVPAKTLCRVALNSPNWKPGLLSWAGSDALESAFRLPFEHLLSHHTVFNYATSFMSSTQYRQTVDGELQHRLGGTGAHLSALMQNATHAAMGWRFCNQCVRAELASLGYSYWHRSHNLPAVTACWTHATALRQTAWPVAGSSIRLVLPHEAESCLCRRRSPTGFELKLAQLSAEALLPSRPLADQASAAWYRGLLTEGGLISAGSAVSAGALADILVKAAGVRSLKEMGLLPRMRNPWPALMVREGTKVPFMPLKHLMLRAALATLPNAAIAALNHRPSGPPPSSSIKLDSHYARAASKTLRSLATVVESGISTEAFLRRAGCWGAYKHRKHEMPRLRHVVLNFRASDATLKRLGTGKRLYRNFPNETT